jgi:hypothetical protein
MYLWFNFRVKNRHCYKKFWNSAVNYIVLLQLYFRPDLELVIVGFCMSLSDMLQGKVMTACRGLCWTSKSSWFYSCDNWWYGFLVYGSLWPGSWVLLLWKAHIASIFKVQNGGTWYPCVRLPYVNWEHNMECSLQLNFYDLWQEEVDMRQRK